MMKDLFSGSLGKLNNHGGSRMFTTPNTILVPPEYEIEIGKHGDFVSCSLDGRLWLFKDEVVVLKWNEETEKMEFSTSVTFNDYSFIVSGIDWILTDKAMIVSQNKEPYYYQVTDKFENSNQFFMIDNFSLLPSISTSIGNYQLVNSFLIRRSENEKVKFYEISYLDGIEELNQNARLITYNEQLWLCINGHFGSAVLVPRIIQSDGKFTSFYVGLIPKYKTIFHYNNVNFIPNETTFPKEFFRINLQFSSFLCQRLEGANVYSLSENSYRNLIDKEYTYFDVFSKNWRVISDNKLTFLDENLSTDEKQSFKVRGVNQWIIPASNEKVECIIDNAIISSLENNDIIVTYPNSEFYRELLQNKQVPLTPFIYNKFRLSLGFTGENEDKIGVNKILSDNSNLESLSLEIKKLVTFELVSDLGNDDDDTGDIKNVSTTYQTQIITGWVGDFIEYPELSHHEPIYETVTIDKAPRDISITYYDKRRKRDVTKNVNYDPNNKSQIIYESSNYRTYIIKLEEEIDDTHANVTVARAFVDDYGRILEYEYETVTLTKIKIPDQYGDAIIYLEIPNYIEIGGQYSPTNDGDCADLINSYSGDIFSIDNQVIHYENKVRFTFTLNFTNGTKFYYDILGADSLIEGNSIQISTKKESENSELFIVKNASTQLGIRVSLNKNILKELTEIDTEVQI